jgi:hypothetical protein
LRSEVGYNHASLTNEHYYSVYPLIRGEIMRTYLLLLLPFLLIPAVSYADFDPMADSLYENKGMTLTVDLSLFDYTPKSLKKAAYLAFLKRNWDIQSASANHFVGKIDSGMTHVVVEMVIDDHILIIRTLKGSDMPRESWLTNLKKDFLVFLVENSD